MVETKFGGKLIMLQLKPFRAYMILIEGFIYCIVGNWTICVWSNITNGITSLKPMNINLEDIFYLKIKSGCSGLSCYFLICFQKKRVANLRFSVIFDYLYFVGFSDDYFSLRNIYKEKKTFVRDMLLIPLLYICTPLIITSLV